MSLTKYLRSWHCFLVRQRLNALYVIWSHLCQKLLQHLLWFVLFLQLFPLQCWYRPAIRLFFKLSNTDKIIFRVLLQMHIQRPIERPRLKTTLVIWKIFSSLLSRLFIHKNLNVVHLFSPMATWRKACLLSPASGTSLIRLRKRISNNFRWSEEGQSPNNHSMVEYIF